MRFPLRTMVVVLMVALMINGCILERIFRVKRQLCEFEKNFQIEISEGFRVLLREPVMLDEDITWLAGAEPSEREYADRELVMTYIAERNGASLGRQYDLPVVLRFVRMDRDYRLKEGYLGKNLADILTVELLTQLMQSVCRAEKSLAKQQIFIDIKSLDRSLLPARSDIVHILGPPNPNTGDGDRLVYDYRLKNNDVVDQVAAIDIQFDGSGEKILRLKMKYLRYNLDADFEMGMAILKVDIFNDEKTWERNLMGHRLG
jgi:hypothetical protein